MGILTNTIFLNDAYDRMEGKYQAMGDDELLAMDPADFAPAYRKRK